MNSPLIETLLENDSELFSLTYALVDRETCQATYLGYLPHSGEVPENRNHHPKNPAKFSLNEAKEIFDETCSGVYPVEANCYPCNQNLEWITWIMENEGTISLHFPKNMPFEEKLEIARFFGVKA